MCYLEGENSGIVSHRMVKWKEWLEQGGTLYEKIGVGGKVNKMSSVCSELESRAWRRLAKELFQSVQLL